MLLIRPILLIFSIAFSGAAQASDWQYAGFSKIGSDETYLFYDAEGIQRPSHNLARYWLKAMTRVNLDRYFAKHEKLLVEKTARKIGAGYVPKFYQLNAIRSQYGNADVFRDAAIEITSYEVVANERDALVKHKLYFELNCADRSSRILEILSYDLNGLLKRAGAAQANYQFIPPDSNGEFQSQLICTKE